MMIEARRVGTTLAFGLAAAFLSGCGTFGTDAADKDGPHAVLVLQQEEGLLGMFGGTRIVVDKINGEEAGTLWSAGSNLRVPPGPLELVTGAIEDNHYGVCVLTFVANAGATYDIVADRADDAAGEKYRVSLAERGGPTLTQCTAEREPRPFTPLPSVLKGPGG